MIAGTDISLRTLVSQHIHRVLFQTAEPFRLKWPPETWPKTLTLWPLKCQTQELLSSLKRIRRTEGIVYQWAIAPRLSQPLGLPATAIAHDLVACLTLPTPFRDEAMLLDHAFWSHCQVIVRQPHWIQIEVGDRALALWLQSVGDRPALWETMPNGVTAPVADSQRPRAEDIFPLQATHARCCSLLRLAEREGFIALIPSEAEGVPQVIHAPHPLPWLTEAGQLQLSHPIERQLLKTWIDLLDEPEASLHRTHTLSAQFYAFEAACRLLGVAGHDPAQAWVRLGLVLLVRHYLGRTLTNAGVKPLTEL